MSAAKLTLIQNTLSMMEKGIKNIMKEVKDIQVELEAERRMNVEKDQQLQVQNVQIEQLTQSVEELKKQKFDMIQSQLKLEKDLRKAQKLQKGVVDDFEEQEGGTYKSLF